MSVKALLKQSNRGSGFRLPTSQPTTQRSPVQPQLGRQQQPTQQQTAQPQLGQQQPQPPTWGPGHPGWDTWRNPQPRQPQATPTTNPAAVAQQQVQQGTKVNPLHGIIQQQTQQGYNVTSYLRTPEQLQQLEQSVQPLMEQITALQQAGDQQGLQQLQQQAGPQIQEYFQARAAEYAQQQLQQNPGADLNEIYGGLIEKAETDGWDQQDFQQALQGFAQETGTPPEQTQQPGFLNSFVNWWGGLDNWQKVAVVLGGTAAVGGLANVLFGGGGAGSMLTSLLGAGAAAWAGGMFGNPSGHVGSVKDFFLNQGRTQPGAQPGAQPQPVAQPGAQSQPGQPPAQPLSVQQILGANQQLDLSDLQSVPIDQLRQMPDQSLQQLLAAADPQLLSQLSGMNPAMAAPLLQSVLPGVTPQDVQRLQGLLAQSP